MTKIKIDKVKESTIHVTGKNKLINARNGDIGDTNDRNSSIEMSQIEGSDVEVTGGDYIEFSTLKFQSLVDSVENVLSKRIENQYTKEMLQIVNDVKKEKGKPRPNISTLIALLSKLAKLIPLANLEEPAKKLLQTFIDTVKGNIL